MLILPPLREPPEVVEDLLGVRVEDVRAVAVNQDAVIVVAIVRVPTDVVSAIDNQNLFVEAVGEPFGQDTPGETSSDDQVIKHKRGVEGWRTYGRETWRRGTRHPGRARQRYDFPSW